MMGFITRIKAGITPCQNAEIPSFRRILNTVSMVPARLDLATDDEVEGSASMESQHCHSRLKVGMEKGKKQMRIIAP